MNHSLNPTLARLLTLCRMNRSWTRGEGVWLFDEDGRRFLDCYAQYGAVALGHNAPCVTDAVHAALAGCEPAMVQPYRAPYAEQLANALTRLAPGDLPCCVFATSGAEAVEAAIKLVRARTRRPIILSATGSFHGKTLGALALNGQRHHGEGFGPLPAGFERVEFGDADALAARLAGDAERIAALFLEPIQGERGVHLPPPGYLARVRELCTRHGVALVFDEVQTGLGRTGRMFACEHDAVAPDVLVLGKALGGGLFPLSACIASEAMWDAGFALRHSSTFANNNVACRVGLAVLDALTAGGLCEDAARKGEYLLGRLRQMAERYPRIVAAVRGRGLMSAIELRPLGEQSAFLSFLSNQGLYAYAVAAAIAETASVLVLPTLGDGNVLRVAPPLVITDRQLATAIDGIEAVVQLLDRNPAQTIVRALGALERPAPEAAAKSHASAAAVAPRMPADAPPPDYAFIIHYTSLDDVVATDPGLGGLTRIELRRFCGFMGNFAPGVLMRAPAIRSATGATANGLIMALPLLPEDMARRGRRRVAEDIKRLVDLAATLGARVVGLGGYTTPYSRRGLEVVGRGPAITTGNALTAGMAIRALKRTTAARGLRLRDARVAVVGAAGSVGALCARMLAREQVRHLVLIGNPATGTAALRRIFQQLERDVHTSIEITTGLTALAACDLIVTATTAGRPILDTAPLRPGTIICDVARPPDTAARLRARADLTVIEGGRVALPDPTTRFGVGNLQGLPDGVTLACLAETILLALEGEPRDSGIGDDVALAQVDCVLAMASRHGFRLAGSSLQLLNRSRLRRFVFRASQRSAFRISFNEVTQMAIDLSISRWVGAVPARQWAREDLALDALGGAMPGLILGSPPLAQVHRLDLALFVVFEEAALRVSGALTRLAPSIDAMNFAAQQTLDEARHHEMFHRRLMLASAAMGADAHQARGAILTPPLQRFIERCYEVADGGSFVDAMVLMNLVLEGMAHPVYSYEERYWKPLDPYLSSLVHSAFTDETRHVAFGALTVRTLLAGDPGRRARAAALCAEAGRAMGEVFDHYIREFVGLFDAVAVMHPELFAGAEFAPGRLIAQTPYEEQVALIRASIEKEHARLITRAALN